MATKKSAKKVAKNASKPGAKSASKSAAKGVAKGLAKPAVAPPAKKAAASVISPAAPAPRFGSSIEDAMRAVAARPAMAPAPAPVADVQREVEQFLYRQSDLLDAKQWQAFINLFTDDGMYWMPSLPTHTNWDGVPSILAEDRDMMTVRMKRVSHPNAWSQQAEWATSHVVSNVVIERVDANTGDIHVRSRFHMMELRRDDVRHFGGTYRHHLQRTPNGLRIKLERVDLFNAQAPYEYVLQVWV